jgi:amino acid transporter
MSSSYEKHLEADVDYKGEPADVGVKVESGEAFAVSGYEQEETQAEPGLKRELKSRHIAMISIGGEAESGHGCVYLAKRAPLGVIGTGLFLGTAGALANGGPLGLLLGYTVVG